MPRTALAVLQAWWGVLLGTLNLMRPPHGMAEQRLGDMMLAQAVA